MRARRRCATVPLGEILSKLRDHALGRVVRSSVGALRRARNLCLGALLETVRDRTKTFDLKQVNRVLLQPHWRKEVDLSQ